ncbi:MAG: RCC1 domain-containing protein [Sandaracinaceae bacterium]
MPRSPILLALLLFGCQSHRLSIELDYASGAARDATSAVFLEVRAGTCDGEVLFRESLPADVPPSVRATLDPGDYAFRVEARNASCETIASGCVVLALPPDEERVRIPLEDVTASRACPEASCSSGVCALPGDGGTSCADTCIGGTCRAEVCCTGCWNGSTCDDGVTDAACGLGGDDACARCDADTFCGAGLCRAPLELSASNATTFLRVGRALYSAGDTSSDQRGVLSSARTDAFVKSAGEFVDVAAAARATCAIEADGALRCWGANDLGILGTGEPTSARYVDPQRVGSDLWIDVEAGHLHMCAIRADRRLFCWGSGASARLGSPGQNASTPREVSGDRRWRSVSAGAEHTCAITVDGELYCWGNALNGRLGVSGASGLAMAPMLVEGSGWTHVSAGVAHTCAIRGGNLYCWGQRGSEARLGDGIVDVDQETPLLIDDGNVWSRVEAGQFHTCGLIQQRVLCWGNPGDNGHGTGMAVTTPASVAGVSADVLAIGWRNTCVAVGAAGTLGNLSCWGRMEDTSIPLGTGATQSDVPMTATLDPAP